MWARHPVGATRFLHSKTWPRAGEFLGGSAWLLAKLLCQLLCVVKAPVRGPDPSPALAHADAGSTSTHSTQDSDLLVALTECLTSTLAQVKAQGVHRSGRGPVAAPSGPAYVMPYTYSTAGTHLPSTRPANLMQWPRPLRVPWLSWRASDASTLLGRRFGCASSADSPRAPPRSPRSKPSRSCRGLGTWPGGWWPT